MRNTSLEEIRQSKYDLSGVIENYPLSLDEVCDALGVYVDLRSDLPNDISGKVFKDSEGYQIYINKNQSSRRIRFTVAHEIGHLIKHKAYIDEHGAILERRNDVSSIPIKMESEANQFAAELLMPKDYFIKKYQSLAQHPHKKNDDIISDLSEYFWVSTQATSYRIISLGLDCG